MSAEGEMVPDWQLERYRLHELSPAEQRLLLGDTARRVYRLDGPRPEVTPC